jgi:hypothetical protein
MAQRDSWVLVDGAEAIIRAWDREVVCYFPASGDCHLFSGAAASVVARLKAGNATTGDLARLVQLDDAAAEVFLQELHAAQFIGRAG